MCWGWNIHNIISSSVAVPLISVVHHQHTVITILTLSYILAVIESWALQTTEPHIVLTILDIITTPQLMAVAQFQLWGRGRPQYLSPEIISELQILYWGTWRMLKIYKWSWTFIIRFSDKMWWSDVRSVSSPSDCYCSQSSLRTQNCINCSENRWWPLGRGNNITHWLSLHILFRRRIIYIHTLWSNF